MIAFESRQARLADVGVCATTSGTEAQRVSSERKATTALVAQVPRPAVSVLLPTPVSELPRRKDPSRAEHVAHQPPHRRASSHRPSVPLISSHLPCHARALKLTLAAPADGNRLLRSRAREQAVSSKIPSGFLKEEAFSQTLTLAALGGPTRGQTELVSSPHFSPRLAGAGANARCQGCRGAIHRARLPTYRTLGDEHTLFPRAVATGLFVSSTPTVVRNAR